MHIMALAVAIFAAGFILDWRKARRLARDTKRGMELLHPPQPPPRTQAASKTASPPTPASNLARWDANDWG
jgi:hypothetical protein